MKVPGNTFALLKCPGQFHLLPVHWQTFAPSLWNYRLPVLLINSFRWNFSSAVSDAFQHLKRKSDNSPPELRSPKVSTPKHDLRGIVCELIAFSGSGPTRRDIQQIILLPQGIFRMIWDDDFADGEAFQKTTRETFKIYGFLKKALVLIG
jgi:hypothetical protein